MASEEDKRRLWKAADECHPDDFSQRMAHYLESLDAEDQVLDITDGAKVVLDPCAVARSTG